MSTYLPPDAESSDNLPTSSSSASSTTIEMKDERQALDAVAYTVHLRNKRLRARLGNLLTVVLDAVLIWIGFTVAYWLRYEVDWPPPFEAIVRNVPTEYQVPLSAFTPYALILVAFLLALFAFKGLYRLPRAARTLDYAGRIISSTTTGIAALIVFVFVYRNTEFYSRLIFAFAWIAIIVLLCTYRAIFLELRRLIWIRGADRERLLVVGNTGLGRNVMEAIVAHPFFGYQLVGYLDDRPQPHTRRPLRHFRHVGKVDDLLQTVRQYRIDQVILALPFWEQHRLPELVSICREVAVDFRVAPDLHQLSFDRVDVNDLAGAPLIGLKEVSLKGVNLILKRLIDLTLVILAAPLLLPLVLLITFLIKRDSPGNAIFQQVRVGKDGQHFIAYKFRTMVVDAEARKADLAALNEADGPIFKIRNDPRVTRIGRFLRRSSLDELPQLWNVLRGEMSLVGPRPPTPAEVEEYDDWHYRRLEVTPGMTGLWQVLGRSDTSFDEMVRLDIYYAENWSPALDLRILVQTIPVVLLGKGAY